MVLVRSTMGFSTPCYGDRYALLWESVFCTMGAGAPYYGDFSDLVRSTMGLSTLGYGDFLNLVRSTMGSGLFYYGGCSQQTLLLCSLNAASSCSQQSTDAFVNSF